MKENELVIKFGGDGNIKVDTLTEFLEIYKELIYIINNKLGYDSEDLTIEVSPPENGSFKIKISPKYKKLLLRSFETIVVSTLGGLLLYYLTKEDNKTLEEIKVLLEKQNTEPDVINNVYNIYNNTPASQKIKQSFIIVDKDESITNLKIDQNEKEIINVPRAEFSKLAESSEQIDEISEPKTDILKDEVNLIIKTLHFEGNAKWVFVFRGYPIKASIKDPNFISKLNNEAFRKGDILKVVLARTRTYDDDLQTYIVDQNSYSIEKVIEHTSKTDNQSALDFK